MELIIDIDEDDYEYMKNGYVPSTFNTFSVIKNGTPLDDTLDKIRAEINQYNRKPSHYPVDMISIETVLQIIDKYKAESEE